MGSRTEQQELQVPMQDLQKMRFALTSEQCELLLAFGETQSLTALSRKVFRDPSVVSRQLQRIAETAPVLSKVKGRWELTAQGKKLNQWTRQAVIAQHEILGAPDSSSGHYPIPSASEKVGLLILGAQRGFLSDTWGSRTNLDAEIKMRAILSAWRQQDRPVFHVRHHSLEKNSPLRKATAGVDPIAGFEELANEAIFQKSTDNAFSSQELLDSLASEEIVSLVVIGFSLNHCVDATIRGGHELGFNLFLVEDAVVAFERTTKSGRTIPAGEIHETVLANLCDDYAHLTSTEALATSSS